MAAFRRVVTALAVLVILAGIASAQEPFNCRVGVAVPPLLRAEGLTELTGDILFSCTGVGVSGLANFNVFVGNTVITSRIASGTSGISEALLLVDEPGAPGRATPVVAPTSTGCTGVAAVDCTYNVFQGVVAGNSVSFLGIPIVPPGTATRVFRITNVRINATTIGGGPGGTPGPVNAVVAISGSTSVPVDDPNQTIGFVTPGMVFDGLLDLSGAAYTGFTFRQCEGVDEDAPIAYLRFRELFATAFKPRGETTQAQPGTIYNTESGLQPTVASGATAPTVSARASWGTRLRAVFANIPLGTEVWVSNYNISTGGSSAPDGAARLTTGSQTAAVATTSATYVRVVAATATSGTAVWEIQSGAVPTVTENYDFGIFFAATPAGQTSPATGVQGTVAGSLAPAPPAFTLASYSVAKGDLIPRFVDTGTPRNLIIFTLCQTNLLFPYVLGGVAGFDTGLAISNTSEDPWGTLPQTGTCTLSFYGANAPAAFTTPSIGATTATGRMWAATAMSLAPAFRGYIIAQCRFQYAHGFAFVSDIGAHDIAMGYLALVMPDIDGIGYRPVGGLLPIMTGGYENLNN